MQVPTTREGIDAPRDQGGWISMRLVVGSIGILLLAVVVIYSLLFKQWCAQYAKGWAGEQVWGAGAFDVEQSKCVKEKSIFSF